MRLIEKIVQDLEPYLSGKTILEIACGDSDFTLNASKYAKDILATDISLARINQRNLDALPKNIQFQEMNASMLNLDNNTFDISVCYNALGHIENLLTTIMIEMIRVTKQGGCLVFIATWKLDKPIIDTVKKIISEHHDLIVDKDIKDKKYYALIVKKN